MPSKNRTAIITGAGRGIGKACALGLARAGFNVLIHDYIDDASKEALEDTKKEIETLNVECDTFQCDIGDLNQHLPLINKAVNLWGRLDCLVSNAGVSVKNRGDILDVTPDSFDNCIRINTRAPFFLIQQFSKAILSLPRPETHQSIVVISSSNAEMVSITRGEYCVSKRATTQTARLFALRLIAEKVGVYELRPGIIKTRMTAPSTEKYDKLIADGLVPEKRWGFPEDIATNVVTLAEGRLPYTCGLAIPIDGGLSMPAF